MRRHGDQLGDNGRNALHSCVKVSIVGKPERRQYTETDASRRIMSCYTGPFPHDFGPLLPSKDDKKLVAPIASYDQMVSRVESEEAILSKTYDINDIYRAIDSIDRGGRVAIYPKKKNQAQLKEINQ